MADANLAVPSPESGDIDDVVLGLETASALWRSGEALDAIRWVRRAAEAAAESGDDMRALTLARAAADLTTAREEEVARSTPPAAGPDPSDTPDGDTSVASAEEPAAPPPPVEAAPAPEAAPVVEASPTPEAEPSAAPVEATP